GPVLDTQRWVRDQRSNIREFPEEEQLMIELSERQGTTDSKEYQELMVNYYKMHMHRLDPWPDELQADMKQLIRQDYTSMMGNSEFTVNGTMKHFDATERLPEIEIPASFTCGRYDEATPETTEYYAGLVPDAEFHI